MSRTDLSCSTIIAEMTRNKPPDTITPVNCSPKSQIPKTIDINGNDNVLNIENLLASIYLSAFEKKIYATPVQTTPKSESHIYTDGNTAPKSKPIINGDRKIDANTIGQKAVSNAV